MIELGIARPDRRRRPEVRSGYENAFLGALESAVLTGSDSAAVPTAVVEAAAGWWARGLSLATVTPQTNRTRCLDPATLSFLGRSLARGGEAVFGLSVEGGAVCMDAAGYWSVYGRGPRPSGWNYRITWEGPSHTTTEWRGAESVAHVRYSWNPRRPWFGLSPAASANLSSRLVGGLERQLSEEAAGPSGYVLPMPDSGDDGQDEDAEPAADRYALFLRDLGRAAGGTIVAPATGDGLGAGAAAAPADEYMTKRYGANYPEAVVLARAQAGRELLAAYGVQPALVDERPSGQTLREAWRIFSTLTLQPLGRLIAAQLGPALGEPGLAFNFEAARAADVATMARAYRSLIDAKMSDADARARLGW